MRRPWSGWRIPSILACSSFGAADVCMSMDDPNGDHPLESSTRGHHVWFAESVVEELLPPVLLLFLGGVDALTCGGVVFHPFDVLPRHLHVLLEGGDAVVSAVYLVLDHRYAAAQGLDLRGWIFQSIWAPTLRKTLPAHMLAIMFCIIISRDRIVGSPSGGGGGGMIAADEPDALQDDQQVGNLHDDVDIAAMHVPL